MGPQAPLDSLNFPQFYIIVMTVMLNNLTGGEYHGKRASESPDA